MGIPKIRGGYILISRKLIESEIWRKPPLYVKIWVYLLSRAQHGDYKKLKRGQLVTSIPEIMEACSWYVGYRKVTPTKDQVYKVLEWLRQPSGKNSRNECESNYETDTKATMITTTKATQCMLVNIENYSFYQDSRNYESNDENNSERDAKATRRQRLPDNINKNVYKNDKKKIFLSDSDEYRLAEILLRYVLENNPSGRVPEDEGLQKWAKTIDLMLRVDGRSIDEVKGVIQFSQTDSFWMTNILSADKLRKQYDQLVMKMKVPVQAKQNNTQQSPGTTYPKCKSV